jgi:hypothetical protein
LIYGATPGGEPAEISGISAEARDLRSVWNSRLCAVVHRGPRISLDLAKKIFAAFADFKSPPRRSQTMKPTVFPLFASLRWTLH